MKRHPREESAGLPTRKVQGERIGLARSSGSPPQPRRLPSQKKFLGHSARLRATGATLWRPAHPDHLAPSPASFCLSSLGLPRVSRAQVVGWTRLQQSGKRANFSRRWGSTGEEGALGRRYSWDKKENVNSRQQSASRKRTRRDVLSLCISFIYESPRNRRL